MSWRDWRKQRKIPPALVREMEPKYIFLLEIEYPTSEWDSVQALLARVRSSISKKGYWYDQGHIGYTDHPRDNEALDLWLSSGS